MRSYFRHVRGNPQIVGLPKLAADLIGQGVMMFWDAAEGAARPVTVFENPAEHAATIAANFLGFSWERRPAGLGGRVGVGTAGQWMLDADPNWSGEVLDPVAMSDDGLGVVAAPLPSLAIGTLVQPKPRGRGAAIVEVRSRIYLPGGADFVAAAVDAEVEIAVGDLLWLDIDDAKPASAQEDQGTEPANQAEFAARFLGVAIERSLAGEAAPIRVATTGVFQFDCAEATFELGDLVGAAENAEGDALLDRQLVKVAAAEHAIGRVARREPAETTRVLVDIRSTVMTGGVAGSTAIIEN